MIYHCFFLPEIRCEDPKAPDTMEEDVCTASYWFESLCAFRCKPGLRLPNGGNAFIKCEATKTWSGQLSECEGKGQLQVKG